MVKGGRKNIKYVITHLVLQIHCVCCLDSPRTVHNGHEIITVLRDRRYELKQLIVAAHASHAAATPTPPPPTPRPPAPHTRPILAV